MLGQRRIAEENLNLLRRRHGWLERGGSNILVGMDEAASSVVRSLTVDSISRVADSAAPLFGLSLDRGGLENLSKAQPCSFPSRDLEEFVTQENEEVLANRWAAVQADEIQAKLSYGLTQPTVEWLRRATWGEISRVIRSGHQCVRFVIKPQYLWQAAKCLHLTQTQRTALALTGIKPNYLTKSVLQPGQANLEPGVLNRVEKAAQETSQLWDSPSFNSRFEQLVMFSGRPSLLRQLLDINPTSKELRRRVKIVEDKYHILRAPPRAKPPSFNNSQVLKTELERYHASILMSLLQAGGAAAAVAEGAFTEHLLEIYQKYLLLTGTNISNAVIDFEVFLQLTYAIGSGLAESAACANCGSSYMYKSREGGKDCPVCILHGHQKFDITSLLRSYHEQETSQAAQDRPSRFAVG